MVTAIKDAILKRRNKAIDDVKWAHSDIEKAKLEGIVEGLNIAFYMINGK